MHIIIMFDLVNNGDTQRFKSGLTNLGYRSNWTLTNNSNDVYHLPRNVMWKMNTTLQDVYNEVQLYCRTNGIELARFIAVPSAPWTGINGTAPPA